MTCQVAGPKPPYGCDSQSPLPALRALYDHLQAEKHGYTAPGGPHDAVGRIGD